MEHSKSSRPEKTVETFNAPPRLPAYLDSQGQQKRAGLHRKVYANGLILKRRRAEPVLEK